MLIHFTQAPEELEKIAKKLNLDPARLSGSVPAASLDMWKTILNNKLVVSLVCFLFSLVMAWGIWATNAIHAQDKAQAVQQESVENIEGGVGDLKEDTKEIRKEQNDNFKDVMKILLDIQKQIKDNE